MKIVATGATAALAGAWTVVGFVPEESFEKTHLLSVSTHNIVFLCFAFFFFFVPVSLFVIGPRYLCHILSWPGALFTREYWQDFVAVVGRMFCWFGGAAAAAAFFYLAGMVLAF